MKLAIAADGNNVSEHFGQCEGYMLFTIEDGKVTDRHAIESPGHAPGVLPALLSDLGAEVVIAGGMGPKAVDLFCQHGIVVYVGVSGDLDDVAEQFIRGELQAGSNVCHH